MTELALSFETSRVWVGALLVAMGCVAMMRGVRMVCERGRRRRSWPAWALTYLFVFRRVVVGACVVGAGVGLAGRVDWLLAVSVCVGIGELLESSYYIGVLRYAGVTSIGEI